MTMEDFMEDYFHMSDCHRQEDIIVFITDFDFQLSTNVYGPSYQLFSPGDPKVIIKKSH